MIGRAAALIYGLASYFIFSLSFAYTPAFLGNFLVPKTIDVGADSAPTHAVVISFLRAQHLCADLERSVDPDILAVAPDRRDRLAR
jgi:hypothetical protein